MLTEHAKSSSFGFAGGVSLLIVTLVLGINFAVRGFLPMSIRNIDETAWVYGSYYYNLAFVQRDLFSPEWRVRDAIDHPPVAKYFIGCALAAGGYQVSSVEFKHRWYERSDVNQQEILVQEASLLPPQVLPIGRFLSTLLYAASSLLLGSIAYRLVGSKWAAVGTVTSMTVSPFIRDLAVNVMAEGVFMFLLVLCLFLQHRAARRWSQNADASVAVFFAAITTGLLANTKINGLAAIPITLIALTAARFFTSRTKRSPSDPLYIAIPVFLVVSLATVILANPSYWIEPIRVVQAILRYRFLNLEGQQAFIPHLNVPTIPIKVAAILSAFFKDNEPLYPFCVLLFLVVLGISRSIREIPARRAEWSVLLSQAAGWLLCNWLTFQINSPRYLLGSMPFIFLLAGVGLSEIIRMATTFPSTWKSDARPILIASTLMLIVPWSIEKVTTQSYMKTHPLWVHHLQSRQEELIRESEEESVQAGPPPEFLDYLVPRHGRE